ncbi:MAG TPA: hypothetical protein VIU15_06790 [Streptomyces sp.]
MRYAGFPLWLLGSIIPAIDGIALHRPTRPLGEHRATAPFSLLRDVLSHDTTPQIRPGHHGPEAAATAEAYWLKAALPAAP